MAKKVTKLSLYGLLGVVKTATSEEIQKAYRLLAAKYHPDHAPDNKTAAEKFLQVKEAYEILSDQERRTRYDKTGDSKPLTIISKQSTYTVETSLREGDLAKFYLAGNKVLKVAKDPAVNDLLENEARLLKKVFPPNQKEEKFYRYFPHLTDAVKIKDGPILRQVNVLNYLESFSSIEQVRGAFPSGVRPEHGVWMFNRILEALYFLHTQVKIIHGGITPAHVMVCSRDVKSDPNAHGAKLISFSAAVEIGDHARIKVLAPAYEALYPPEILKKSKIDPSTDIYMAAQTITYVLGGTPGAVEMPPEVPSYLTNFLRSCMLMAPSRRPQDAWKLHEELKEVTEKYWGSKKYIKFTMP